MSRNARLAGLCCAALLSSSLLTVQCSPSSLTIAQGREKENSDLPTNVYAPEEQLSNVSVEEDQSVTRDSVRSDDTQAVRRPLTALFSGKSSSLRGAIQMAKGLAAIAISCIGLAALIKSAKSTEAKKSAVHEASANLVKTLTMQVYNTAGSERANLPKSLMKGSRASVLEVGLTPWASREVLG